MKTKVNPHAVALLDWAKEDTDNRVVITIAYERKERTKDGENCEILNLMSGSGRSIINALKIALQQNDKQLAELIRVAVKELAAEAALKKFTDIITKK